ADAVRSEAAEPQAAEQRRPRQAETVEPDARRVERRPGGGIGALGVVRGRDPCARQRAPERAVREQVAVQVEHAELDAREAAAELAQEADQQVLEPALLERLQFAVARRAAGSRRRRVAGAGSTRG